MVQLADEIVKDVAGRPWVLVRCDRRSPSPATPVSLVPTLITSHGAAYLTAYGSTYPLSRKLGLLHGGPNGSGRGRVSVSEATPEGVRALCETGAACSATRFVIRWATRGCAGSFAVR